MLNLKVLWAGSPCLLPRSHISEQVSQPDVQDQVKNAVCLRNTQ